MTAKTKDQIKAFFESGDKPTESQFIDTIDSYVDKLGPIGDIETAASAGAEGFCYVSGGGGELVSPANARTLMGITVYTTALAIAAVQGQFLTTAQAALSLAATTAQVVSGEATDVFVAPKTLQEKTATTAEALAGSSQNKFMNPILGKQQIMAVESFGTKLLHVQDQKSSGTNGGDFNSGADRTRTLNTVLTNEITGASLSSNQITLPVGTYFLEGLALANQTTTHQTLIYNVTDATEILRGFSNNATNGTANTSDSYISGRFTITAQKVIEFRHRCGSSQATNGFGIASGFGTEVYADLKIWKVA